MSEQVRHKLIDFAVAPPPAAWESIAERLDDDRKYTVLASKMDGFEAPPPPSAWEAISTRLGDDGQYARVAAKMTHFEAAPPAPLWDKIAASLSEPNTTVAAKAAPVIQLRKILYRALAAAVIISVIAGGWMMLSNKSSVSTEIVKNNLVVPPAPSSPGKEEKNTSPATPSTGSEETAIGSFPTETVVSAPQVNDHHHAANNTVSEDDRVLKYAMVQRLPAFHEGPIVISSAPIADANGVVIRDIDVLTTNSNYIMVTGPNGQQARISAKFASVIRYLNGSTDDTEEYLDKVIKESDTWKKRFLYTVFCQFS
jgi:hypothetical protein